MHIHATVYRKVGGWGLRSGQEHEQQPGSRNGSRDHEGTLLTGLLSRLMFRYLSYISQDYLTIGGTARG